MTKDEEKRLAEQLFGNPLFELLLEKLETEAVESLVYADTEQKRVETQWRVRAVRSLRSDCSALLNNTQKRKGAIA